MMEKGDYDAVIVCLGSGANFLPELSGRLPLVMWGVIAHLQLPDHIREDYRKKQPLYFQMHGLLSRTSNIVFGVNIEWKSRNSSRYVPEKASKALEELLPKASAMNSLAAQQNVSTGYLQGLVPGACSTMLGLEN
ncbi:hypothetical protein HAX54_018159 [Datura stramonium]|uniref:Uncharacterized protein n=1 Tax=Datura stramonium TaxID=4076 RepID=A0ABS8ULR6_DATST|nr:hypothetical protein [Datura stramonium]